ncbi:hypothetical protein Tco_0308311 [Tanacetum coccineum]
MAEQQENKKQPQQDRLDEELVPVDDQVRIGLSNYRIALEKSQHDVIYKVCLAILKQSMTYFFTLDDQIFEVNADLIRDALRITPKIDATLRNLKFTNKGAKDPIFGMPIPMMMLSEEIKASKDYLNYLAKSMGTQPVKVKGKGFLTKKGVEIVVETIRIPKKRRAVHTESDEGTLDHSKKLKSVETMSETARYLLEMKQARKARKQDFILKQRPKGPGEGSSMASEVPIGPSGSSSSSSSDDEIEDISSDKERSEANDTEKANAEKAEADKAEEENTREEQHVDGQGGNEQAGDVQAEVHVSEPQTEKPATILISSSLTLSSAEYGNQFINDNPDVSIKEVLKDPAEMEVQSMVEIPNRQKNPADQRPPLKSKKPEAQVDSDVILKRLRRLEKKVEALSKIDHTEAIDKSMQAHLKNVLPKEVPDFGKKKQEKAVKQSMPKYSTKPFDEASLKEYDQKDKLIKLMMKSKSYNTHPAHMKLYDALMDSLLDPSADADKETKKRKRKDSDASSSKKNKDNEKSSKSTKSPSGPSPTQKAVDDDELIQDGVVDDTKMIQDDDMSTDDMPHDDDAPTQDRSKWFKQDVVVGPETPDPEWHKKPNADDAPKQPWFNEMVKAKGPRPAFKLLKGNYKNYIKLEYNTEKCYLAMTDQIDWANLEGDRCPYDLSKPLSLQGPPCRTTIPVDFFFNKDLKYLTTRNTEKKYASLLTKPKVAQYELEGLDEMIPNL